MKLLALGPGRILFAIAMLGLGVVTLACRDFALTWQPVPAWVPGRELLIYVSALCLLAGGVGILVEKIAARAALFLWFYLCVFWVLPHIVRLLPQLASVAKWLGFCETVGVMSGSWLLWAMLLRQDAVDPASARSRRDTESALRLARVVFGICCLVYGLSHFVYVDFTAAMIPRWLPLPRWIAYATGAGHVTAGVGIIFGIFPRLAATFEAAMMSSFVVLLHIPSLWATPPPSWAPTIRTELTPLFWACALAAAAWLVAQSFAGRPWGSRCRDPLPLFPIR
jgi:uncharacterized membrane protein YphA (DoxX/SURF4 family)